MKPLADCRLYAFVDTAYLEGRDPADVARALCSGGADLIQLRAKDATRDDIRAMARRILPVTCGAGAGLVINDHLDIAIEIGADISHLGQEDFFDAGHAHVSDLRPSGKGPLIGLSTHSPDQAERAIRAGADYVAIGPVYPTGTKPGAPPVTLEYVRWASNHIKIPWFAIGGINLSNIHDVLAAGASRICVVSAILNAPDIAAACREFRGKLE